MHCEMKKVDRKVLGWKWSDEDVLPAQPVSVARVDSAVDSVNVTRRIVADKNQGPAWHLLLKGSNKRKSGKDEIEECTGNIMVKYSPVEIKNVVSQEEIVVQ